MEYCIYQLVAFVAYRFLSHFFKQLYLFALSFSQNAMQIILISFGATGTISKFSMDRQAMVPLLDKFISIPTMPKNLTITLQFAVKMTNSNFKAILSNIF